MGNNQSLLPLALNLGCELDKRGDVNLDINPIVRSDIVADAIALPFRDNVFNKVISFQCLDNIHAYALK